MNVVGTFCATCSSAGYPSVVGICFSRFLLKRSSFARPLFFCLLVEIYEKCNIYISADKNLELETSRIDFRPSNKVEGTRKAA